MLGERVGSRVALSMKNVELVLGRVALKNELVLEGVPLLQGSMLLSSSCRATRQNNEGLLFEFAQAPGVSEQIGDVRMDLCNSNHSLPYRRCRYRMYGYSPFQHRGVSVRHSPVAYTSSLLIDLQGLIQAVPVPNVWGLWFESQGSIQGIGVSRCGTLQI